MGIDRIATRASNELLNARILKLQATLADQQMQVASEKKSQTYQGIALDSQRLLNMENERRMADRYVTVNEVMDVRIQTTTAIVHGIQLDGEEAPSGGIKQIIQDFRTQLVEFQGGSLTNEQRVLNIQERAIEAMKSMEIFLNEEVNGQFLFGGTSTQTQPTDLNADSLASFQATYDGIGRMYPWTRDAHVDSDLTTTAATTGALTTVWNNGGTADDGTDDTGTITAATAGTLSSIPVGSLVTITGGVNDGKTVTVTANTGTVISFAGTVTPAGGTASFTVAVPEDVADSGGAEAGVTLSVNSYYSGDRETISHRLTQNASMDIEINATNAAFEKAIRAMGIMAQGVYGTNGGLDQNSDRADEAYWLLTAALNITNTGTPPYGAADQTGTNKYNIEQLELDLGFHSIQISETNVRLNDYISFLDERTARIENIDDLEVMTSILDNENALEASYQVFARIKQLSLTKYL
ncbi:MAG: hypothetical protein H7841_02910 [Magnetospirillum sp. WYHS-4]